MTRSTAIETRHRVLLVDDDAVSLELMALLLAHEGHQVLRAHDAGAALDLLSSDQVGRPDVLLVVSPPLGLAAAAVLLAAAALALSAAAASSARAPDRMPSSA